MSTNDDGDSDSDTVEVKHRQDGPARYTGRGISTRPGDRAEVSGDVAEYLVDERGYFDRATDLTSSEEDDGEEGAPDLEELLDKTVTEIEELVEAGEYDNALSVIEDYEAAGDDRSGVYQALDSRRQTLQERED